MSPGDARPAIRRAVVIPCLDEARSIAGVVRGFRAALPDARIHVFDNGSTDGTAQAAREAGAEIHHVALRGKGHVVRRMFADVEADTYVLVDGDGTYDAAASARLVARLEADALDMVNAARRPDAATAWRPGHALGNRVLTGLVALLFGDRMGDLLSGYRAFSRRFVKSFPALSGGFEIETELSVHALRLNMPIAELPTRYGARMEGSRSKLATWRDGLRILRTIVLLVEQERPLLFFGASGLVLLLAGFAVGVPVVVGFLHTGLVPRLPSAVLATGLVILSFLAATCGLILDSVTRGRLEARHMTYLAIPAPARDAPPGRDPEARPDGTAGG